MNLVVNEWLPEYFRPEASKNEKELLEVFLNKFLENQDTLTVRRPSPFLQKILLYAKLYQANTNIYQNLYRFIKVVLQDSKRCVFIDEECILEEAIIEKLNEGNYSSDTYLFEAASKTDNKLIITTDDKLCRQMNDIAAYNVINLTDFLKQY